MQLNDMRSRLRQAVGNPTTSDVPDTMLTQALNDGYTFIANRYAFNVMRKRTTFPTATTANQYLLPTDCFALRYVRDNTNFRKLTKRDDAWLAQQGQSTPGKPTDYLRGNTYIQLVPYPDGVYEIEIGYRPSLAALAADADVPVLPEPWHYGIVLQGRWVFFDQLKPDYAKAMYALNLWKEWVRTMVTDIEEEKVDIDVAVEVPTLSAWNSTPRLDFDHSD